MKSVGPRPKAHTPPLLLTSRHEQILRAMYDFRYLTALDVAHLLYAPTSLTYVRRILSALAGGEDLQTNTYLCRFQLPTASTGNREKIYTLGVKGRDFLAKELGLPVDWYFRPYKLKHLSYSHVLHHLTLARVVVAAHQWCRKQPDVHLVQTRLCYALARTPGTVTVETRGKTATLPVIPDAWLVFERGTDGQCFPILLEIDRGMEYQQKFKQHIRARIAFIRSGQYAQVFGTQAVSICYATTGQSAEYRQTRRETMCSWTQEVLGEQQLEHWAGVFRFASLVFEDIFALALFEKPVWYRPDDAEPVPLLTP